MNPFGARLPTVLARYEMRIRTVMSEPLAASLPVRVTRTAVPRHTVYRLHIRGDRDIAEVVGRLDKSGVEVLDIRVASVPS